jgi:NADH dehydrogenase
MAGDTRKIATIFGGTGFIGRHLIQRLARQGYRIRLATRDVERAGQLKPMGAVGQIVPLHISPGNSAGIDRAVMGADLVVNLAGILAERRKGDFERVHTSGPRLIAERCFTAGVPRLVHISAIGAAADSRSGYARSKARGEITVAAAFPEVVILRPSIVFGPEDAFFNRFAGLISGDTRFQPVYVGDVAEAIIAALELSPTAPGLYELGGPTVLTFREVLRYILSVTQRHRPLFEVSPKLARFEARILERLPGRLLTTDQLEMLGQDNVASGELPGLEALGIIPKPMELVVPTYLARYRQGGRAYDPVDRTIKHADL